MTEAGPPTMIQTSVPPPGLAATGSELELAFLREQTARWHSQLSDEFATVSSDVEFDLQRRIQHVLTAAEATVDSLDPHQSWGALAGWVQERLAFELTENHAMALRVIRALSIRSARHFGLAESHIVDPPAPRTPDGLSVSLANAPSSPGVQRSGTIMNVVLRAYLGFVMFFMISNFSGLALPVVYGIVPALLLAGLAVHEEGNRAVTTRRMSANQVIRSYIIEYGMWVSKDSRDLLRRLERELRDGYEARIEHR